MKPCEFIEKLANENKGMADALENKRFVGMKRILADFYPDNAHFIYELLQNAEDTKATKVAFELKQDKLIYTHNGQRIFTERDIESITSIGDSSKADDINTIGKFGVGFKAVFSYTNSPQIYSGEYAFEINNLVMPKCIPDFDRDPQKTMFIFPFNSQSKNKKLAYDEVKIGLEKLHDNTLLFLQNICEISITFEGKNYTIIRNEIDDVRVEIHNSLHGNRSRWLRFKKELPDHQNLYVSVAYAVKKNEKTEKDEIVPINGEVSIFFPAEKETSNLRFHIHAPFASTVARDSFKHDNTDNEVLIDLITDTVVGSMDYIKENGFLTMSFFEVLPNYKDTIPDFYKPIYNKCIKAFKEKPFMLTESGEFQPAVFCVRGVQSIKKLINDEDLSILTDDSNVYWSKNAPRRNSSRADDFIQSLMISEFNDSDFYDKLKTTVSKIEEYGNIIELFKSKSDEWYLQFFNFLKKHIDSKPSLRYSSSFLKFFIRLNDGTLNIERKDCFFMNDVKDDRFLYVKKETYTISKIEDENVNAKAFLEFLGVREVGEKEKIEFLLKTYQKGSFPSFEEHILHMKLLLDYYRKTKDIDIFKKRYLFSCLDSEGEKWGYPTAIYLDLPFKNTNLRKVKHLLDICFLNEKYKEHLTENEIEEIIEILLKTGAKEKLPIENVDIWKNPDYYSKLHSSRRRTNQQSFDCNIQKLDQLIEEKDKDISELIWKTMIDASHKQLRARNKVNDTEGYKYADSTLVHILKENAWIPDKNGNFYKPADISQNDLPKEFVYDDRNDWLTAISFAKNRRKDDEAEKVYREKASIIKKTTGFSLDMLEEAKEKGVTDDDIKNLIEQKNNKKQEVPQPIDIVNSISKHTKSVNKNQEDIDPAIVTNNAQLLDQIRKQHNRTVQKSTVAKSRNYSAKIKEGKEATELFLYGEYKGHCQICGFTFTKTDGKNYFELLDWGAEKITKNRSDVILPASSLCVCANCHAMVKNGDFHPDFIDKLGTVNLSKFSFDEFCVNTNTKIQDDEIPECYEFIEMDMFKLPIQLNEEKKYIFYSEEHFLHFYDLACLVENKN